MLTQLRSKELTFYKRNKFTNELLIKHANKTSTQFSPHNYYLHLWSTKTGELIKQTNKGLDISSFQIVENIAGNRKLGKKTPKQFISHIENKQTIPRTKTFCILHYTNALKQCFSYVSYQSLLFPWIRNYRHASFIPQTVCFENVSV